jgi:hypothetical protein
MDWQVFVAADAQTAWPAKLHPISGLNRHGGKRDQAQKGKP